MRVVEVDTVRELSHPDYNVNGVQRNVSNTQLQPRALSELVEAGVFTDHEHKGIQIDYLTEPQQDTVATTTFAFQGRKAYLSWLWVSEPFQENGIGTRLTKEVLQEMKRHGVQTVYTLPKSDEAETIFNEKLDFQNAEPPITNWMMKNL